MRWLHRWFWSPIREGENWAQTIVRVSGNLLRSIFTVLAVSALLASIVSYFSDLARRAQAEELGRQRALLTAIPNDLPNNGCGPEFPLAIRVQNHSDLTLLGMEIQLTARVPGTSANVLGYLDDRLQWDHIVPPNRTLSMCYSLRGFDRSLVYSAAPRAMRLVQTEEWMERESIAAPMDAPTD